MKLIHRSKRGFTLVEMMLALAIITIIGWTTVALMIAVKDSFMTTYNTNDSSDYALLYANGFENSFLAHTQNKAEGKFGTRTDSVLQDTDSHAVFNPRQMKTTRQTAPHDVVDKWVVRTYFYVNPADASQRVQYKIFVIDNYYAPTFRVTSVYEGSVWAPHMGTGKLSFESYPTNSDDGDKFIRLHYSMDGWSNYIKYKNS